MTTPHHRRQRILEHVSAGEVPNQQALLELLAVEGIDTTQTTLSRDLRVLGVIKGPEGYLPPPDGEQPSSTDLEVQRLLAGKLLGSGLSGTLVVLHTPPGHASLVAIELDKAQLDDVVGTIAGDDTIFIATPSAESAAALREKLDRLGGAP